MGQAGHLQQASVPGRDGRLIRRGHLLGLGGHQAQRLGGLALPELEPAPQRQRLAALLVLVGADGRQVALQGRLCLLVAPHQLQRPGAHQRQLWSWRQQRQRLLVPPHPEVEGAQHRLGLRRRPRRELRGALEKHHGCGCAVGHAQRPGGLQRGLAGPGQLACQEQVSPVHGGASALEQPGATLEQVPGLVPGRAPPPLHMGPAWQVRVLTVEDHAGAQPGQRLEGRLNLRRRQAGEPLEHPRLARFAPDGQGVHDSARFLLQALPPAPEQRVQPARHLALEGRVSPAVPEPHQLHRQGWHAAAEHLDPLAQGHAGRLAQHGAHQLSRLGEVQRTQLHQVRGQLLALRRGHVRLGQHQQRRALPLAGALQHGQQVMGHAVVGVHPQVQHVRVTPAVAFLQRVGQGQGRVRGAAQPGAVEQLTQDLRGRACQDRPGGTGPRGRQDAVPPQRLVHQPRLARAGRSHNPHHPRPALIGQPLQPPIEQGPLLLTVGERRGEQLALTAQPGHLLVVTCHAVQLHEHPAGGLRARQGGLGQQLQDEAGHLRGEPLALQLRLGSQDLLNKGRAAPGHGRPPAGHLVQGGAEAVQIHPVVPAAHQRLRGHEGQGAAAGQHPFFHAAGQAEVEQHGAGRAGMARDDEVVGLDVPVHEPEPVHVMQGPGEIHGHAPQPGVPAGRRQRLER